MSDSGEGQEDFSSTVVMNLCKLHSKEEEKAVLPVKAWEPTVMRQQDPFAQDRRLLQGLVCSSCLISL